MKVLVCSKGGCGKSTIVALLSKELAERKNKVLVIDSDESNIGLHRNAVVKCIEQLCSQQQAQVEYTTQDLFYTAHN